MVKRITWALILGLTTMLSNSFAQATEEKQEEATEEKQEEATEEKQEEATETTEEASGIATDEKTVALHGKLKGEWSVVSMQRGAQQMPDEMKSGASFHFTDEGRLMLAGLGPGDADCKLKLDASETPAKISFNPEGDVWVSGIVKVDEEGQVTMCLTGPGGGAEPTEFETGADTPGHMLAVLKKKEAEGSDDK